MNCSVRFTFGFEESALNARTVIKIIPITPIAKKMHEGNLAILQVLPNRLNLLCQQ